jgi:tetratricopeptide (TPR) repeat protein
MYRNRSDSSAWLGANAELHRLVGAYWRARVLLKDRRDVNPAVQLLTEIQKGLSRPAVVRAAAEELPILRARVERLYGEALIRGGNPAGRSELLELADRMREVALAAGQREQFANLLGDLAGDLTILGEHDQAVSIALELIEHAGGPTSRAFRQSNASAWLLQRAVAHRADSKTDEALEDLDAATEMIDLALGEYASIPVEARNQSHAFATREARAIALAISVERALVLPQSLSARLQSWSFWAGAYRRSIFRNLP